MIMQTVQSFLPVAPSFKLDWLGLDRAFPWIRALKDSPHDPIHHREGDPWVHTGMVVEMMIADPAWRELSDEDALVTFLAAVMHDIGKPATAVVQDNGRVTNRGHSRIGAIMTRRILWEQGLEPRLREQVCALIERHQVPFWLYEKPYKEALQIVSGQSLLVRNHLLWLLARADARGRECDDQDMMLEAVDEYREICVQHGCLNEPFAFYGDHERFMFLSNRATIDPRYQLGPAEVRPMATILSATPGSGKTTWGSNNAVGTPVISLDAIRCGHRPHLPAQAAEVRPMVTILSAFPGSGKTSWARDNAVGTPVISLDAIRRELSIKPEDQQGPVLEVAREKAREYLRARQSFVWDATAFTREMRGKTIDLCRQYGFGIRIVAIDIPRDVMLRQNRDREFPVPETVIEKMLNKWEFPRPDEYHDLLWITEPAKSSR